MYIFKIIGRNVAKLDKGTVEKLFEKEASK